MHLWQMNFLPSQELLASLIGAVKSNVSFPAVPNSAHFSLGHATSKDRGFGCSFPFASPHIAIVDGSYFIQPRIATVD
jgi:hypothetical protein